MNAIRARIKLRSDYKGDSRHLNGQILTVTCLYPNAIEVRDADGIAAIFHASMFDFVDEQNRVLPKLCVNLSNCGNPDYGQDPDKRLYGTACAVQIVPDLATAQTLALAYIKNYELGGGNWCGGEVYQERGMRQIARISYNGRAWDMDGKLMQEAPPRTTSEALA